jgi:diguanylate cyclase (GGDEF)-like protein
MGGDEFICLISDKDIENRLQDIIERINNEFNQIIEVENKKCEVGISIGYCIYTGTQDLDELIRKADDGMYQHKNNKKSNDLTYII